MEKIKKFWAILMCAAIIWTFCPAIIAKADFGGWTTAANGIMTITGTNVTVRLSYGTLYIEGNGAIPDYTPQTYTMRPWHYLDFETVSIAPEITEIGSYAFADKTKIKQISIPSTTFVKDNTSFLGLGSYTILRIKGTAATDKQYGTITYTSLDSIAANAPNAAQCMFIMDSPQAAQQFRQKSYPYLKYVYSATDTTSPWQSKIDTTKDMKFDAVCRISPENNLGTLTNFTAQMRTQGSAFMECISNCLGDYTYLCSYNMALTDTTGTLYGTNGSKKYVLYLQPKDRIVARQYCLIEIGPDGQIYYLEDLDNDYATVTFETYYPTSTYALVYKYDMAMLSAMMNSK